LSALVIEDVEAAGEVVCVRAGTRDGPVACPGCGTQTARVHGYHERTVADVPAGGRRVLARVRARRMRCPVPGCPRQTFREQVPGVRDRDQRRTTRLTGQVSAVARELAGRASARLLPALGIGVSRHALLRVLLKIPLPALAVPRVLGTGDFALRRGSACATVLTGAGTGRRAGVVQGRTADVAEKWLRDHLGVEVVCRDGPGAYGEAARQALPDAVQVSGRWRRGFGPPERKVGGDPNRRRRLVLHRQPPALAAARQFHRMVGRPHRPGPIRAATAPGVVQHDHPRPLIQQHFQPNLLHDLRNPIHHLADGHGPAARLRHLVEGSPTAGR